MSTNDLPCIGCDTQEGCGTGTGNWPKPGDPDNNVILKATAVFGGVDVTWTFPNINPQAVQHTLLYRGTIPDFGGAALLAVVAGSQHFDKDFSYVDLSTPYYYWIQIVSVNGTYGEVIGPSMATPKPLIGDMITLLTGRIDQSVLAESLKQEIDRIGGLENDLDNEKIDRVASNKALAEALALVRRDTDQAIIYVNSQVAAVQDGQAALVTRMDTMAVGNEDNAAAIIAERTARVTEDAALSRRIDTVYAETEDNAAAIRDEAEARTSADTALATQITTTQSTLGGQIASVQTEMSTNISRIDGDIDAIGALYTAKVNVNGLVGGFGIFNDGTEVEAGFDVDRFWIGRTGTNKRKPFIIQDGVVYIDEGAINSLTFSKLRSEDGSFVVQDGKIKAEYLTVGELQSNNYVPNTSGWKLDRNGTFELNASVTGQGRMQITNQVIRIWDLNGVLRVRMGIW